jgi:hypothetical protein
MRNRVRLALLLAFFAAAGCAGPDPRCAVLPGGGRYCLQPTTAVAPFELQQKVEAAFDGRRETMIAEIEADANGLRLVVLTPFGHKLVEMSYDNLEAKAAARLDPRLDPALILALLQFTLWPGDAIRAGLGAGMTFEEGWRQRSILMAGEILMTVTYTGEGAPYRRLHVSLPPAGLELDVEALSGMEGPQ